MSLYHLTHEKNLESIMKEGLVPKNSDHCKLIGDDEIKVSLCGKRDIGYWAIILDCPILLKIDNDGIDEKLLSDFNYTFYSEYNYSDIIKPEYITVVSKEINKGYDNECMKKLCDSFIWDITRFTVECAMLYNGHYDDQLKYRREDMKFEANALLFVLPHLDYKLLGDKYYYDFMKSIGEEGDTTFCDAYEYNNDIPTRLWQKLIDYPTDELIESRTKIYNLINNIFPFAQELCTGGWRFVKYNNYGGKINE